MTTPLQSIAREIVRLSDQRGLTPVVVQPTYLVFRPIFLVELTRSLLEHVDRPIRIDWCRPVPTTWSLLGDHRARLQAGAINRALRRALRPADGEATLQITATIARPGGANRQLVIGWCSEDLELPAWTVPINLAGNPTAMEKAA